ncbi:hypothetical protein SISNIDRAFT_463289 [Sistotremastrum niveocremeum HHB9708]|uniref:F-box domain-containing protein n=1 Tax=Sistotremastrum niveocremeum HHB9708 TaxID=1314777 RepID=A0A164YZ57_9AGAM|nr:hypothetical protein SISNIDRAFT_463289 [Sistotremastrum niveocremeum HHB9708]
MTHLPAELCAKIAQEIRQWDNRLAEEKALANLSVVSKTWRPEALRVLWSKVVIDDEDTGKAEPRGTTRLVSLIVNKGYATEIRDLSIDLNMESWPEDERYRERSFPLQSKIINILYTAVNLRRISIRSTQSKGQRILSHLYHCRFPLLRELKMRLSFADWDEEIGCSRSFPGGLDRFFFNHPGLVELDFNVMNDNEFADEPIRLPSHTPLAANILPNLTRFIGGVEEAKFLRPCASLKEVVLVVNIDSHMCYESPEFLNDFEHIKGPLLNVRSLEFRAVEGLYIDLEEIETIDSCFPNLETLRGIDLDPWLVDALLLKKRTLLQVLHKLKEYTYYGVENKGTPPHRKIRRVEKAMAKLPRIFPHLEYASRCVDPGPRRRPVCAPSRLYFQFDGNGGIISREERGTVSIAPETESD